MCTGLEIAAGAALLSSAASAGLGFVQAGQQADAQNAALEAAYAEQTRLQEENNRIAAEKVTDRVRQTNQQLGSIRAAAGELGGGLDAFVIEAGALEGIDLHRIEKNRKNQEDSLQAAKVAGRVSALSNIRQSYAEATTNAVSQGFKVVSGGLQLAEDLGAFDDPTTEKR